MSDLLGPLTASRKTGEEQFVNDKTPLAFTILDFWRWMGSDLVGNTFRGILAEYLVAKALRISEPTRAEWGSFDLTTRDGVKIEVKSCAYLQSWRQKAMSKISFGVRPTRAYDAETGTLAGEVRRQADLYVFALLKHEAKSTLNPMDVSQWQFYVLSAAVLNARLPIGSQQVSLLKLLELHPLIADYDHLADAVGQTSDHARPGRHLNEIAN